MTPREEIREIICDAASRHYVDAKELLRPYGGRRVTAAKWEAMKALRQIERLDGTPRYSFKSLGRIFRCHYTSAMHACRMAAPPYAYVDTFAGATGILRALAEIPGRYMPRQALGGCAASQAVYRLRNTYGADIIQTVTGLGYRLTQRGLEIARALEAAGQARAA